MFRVKKPENIIKESYGEQISIKNFIFLCEKSIYLISSNKDVGIDGYPQNGLLSLSINNVIQFMNGLDGKVDNLNDYIKVVNKQKTDDVRLDIVKIIVALFYNVDIYRLNYLKEDLDEMLSMIFLTERLEGVSNQLMSFVFGNSILDASLAVVGEELETDVFINKIKDRRLKKQIKARQNEMENWFKNQISTDKLLDNNYVL